MENTIVLLYLVFALGLLTGMTLCTLAVYIVTKKYIQKIIKISTILVIPEKISESIADYAHEASYIRGWNACIDKANIERNEVIEKCQIF